MEDATLEVESNILAADKLRGNSDRDRRKGRARASTFESPIFHPQVDELTKLVKSLSAEMEKLKLEGKQTIKIHRMLTIEVILEYQIIPFRSSKEIQ
jgi:hypothetical protein